MYGFVLGLYDIYTANRNKHKQRAFYFSLLAFISMLMPNFASPAENGHIVFVSATDSQIYTTINGTTTQRTFGPHHAEWPAWSPGGQYIAYITRPGIRLGNEIFITATDRQETTRLTFNGGNQSPVWSPDGKKIAFARVKRDDILSDIYGLDVETQSTVQLTNGGIMPVCKT